MVDSANVTDTLEGSPLQYNTLTLYCVIQGAIKTNNTVLCHTGCNKNSPASTIPSYDG